jgi:hypothetical protein
MCCGQRNEEGWREIGDVDCRHSIGDERWRSSGEEARKYREAQG